jgi:hypothetical protein
MTFIKQDGDSKAPKKRKQNKPAPAVQDPDEARYGPEAQAKEAAAQANDYRLKVRSSTCIEEALDGLRSVISTWVTQEREGDNGSSLYSAPSAYPVKVRLVTSDNEDMFDGIVGALEDNVAVMERIATAFERIADVMQGRGGSHL